MLGRSYPRRPPRIERFRSYYSLLGGIGMKTHRVNLTRTNKADRCAMVYRGHSLGVSRTPLLSAARKLLQLGLAKPEDRIETWRDNILSMSAPVEAAAKLDVMGETFRHFIN